MRFSLKIDWYLLTLECRIEKGVVINGGLKKSENVISRGWKSKKFTYFHYQNYHLFSRICQSNEKYPVYDKYTRKKALTDN